MQLLDLKSATIEIRQALNRRKKPLSPFFFMVGAGVSYPPIPLAVEMQEQCRLEALGFGKTAPPRSSAPIDTYSHWFEQAYPHPKERQEFLREVMENALISRASFRLAHLLLDKTVTNLVVTTNFDDFVARALSLFGLRPVVCDHPRTLERIDHGSHDVQIIHIHGSYWFYDCCNLRGEIEERARRSPETFSTMQSVLDEILRTRSPIVVGYSGWEGDVFMSALKRRLSARLGFNLYWFCHNRWDLENLTQWFARHHLSDDNVYAVVPEEGMGAPRRGAARSEMDLNGMVGSGEAASRETDSYPVATGGSAEPVLHATAVFDALIREFRLDAPTLTRDPLDFFANQLRTSLLGDRSDGPETDVYAIRAVIERLERLRQEEKRILPSSGVELKLEAFRNALRQSNHPSAVRLANAIPLRDLTGDQLRELITALANAAPALADSPEEEMVCNDLIVTVGDRLVQLGEDNIDILRQGAEAMVSKAIRLATLNRPAEAVATCDELVRRFGDAGDAGLRNQVARALVTKGTALMALKRGEDEIAAYDEVIRRFGDDPDPVREQIGKALFNKGIRLGALNRNQEAIAAFEEIVGRFGDADVLALREQVAKALFNKGIRLVVSRGNEGAIAAFDELVKRFGDATEPTLCDRVARALFNKGIRLAELGRSDEALAAYDEVIRRFGDASEPALRERVAQALSNKASMLGTLGRSEVEIAIYDEIVQRFRNAPEPILRERAARALVNKGFALGVLNRMDAAIVTCDEAIENFGKASEHPLRELVAKATVNKGIALSVLNRGAESIAAYDEVIARYGDATEPGLRELVIQARLTKGVKQGAMIRG